MAIAGAGVITHLGIKAALHPVGRAAEPGARYLIFLEIFTITRNAFQSCSQHYRPGHRNKQDSSKNGSQQQEFSDFGYGSLVETPEVVSTSSNEEESGPSKRPFHQKPHIQKTRYSKKHQPSAQEKKEIRRKKLMKRSKNTL